MWQKSKKKVAFLIMEGYLFLILAVEPNLAVLTDATDIAPMAHGNIGIITAQEHLVAFRDD